MEEPKSGPSTSEEPDQSIRVESGLEASSTPPQPPREEKPSRKQLQKLWGMAMKLIEDENSLINQRLTLFIAAQGVLGAGVGCIFSSSRPEFVQAPVIFVIACFGETFALMLLPGIRAARRQITATTSWLRKCRDDHGYFTKCPYPPPTGGTAKTVVFGIELAFWPFKHEDFKYDEKYEFTPGPGLQLMSWSDGSGVPTSGHYLVIAGLDSDDLLPIRTFDLGGIRTDTFETRDNGGALHLDSADASGEIL